MDREIINSYIDKYTQKIDMAIAALINIVSIALCAIEVYLLMDIKNYVLSIALITVLIAQFIYFYTIRRKKVMTVYGAIGINFTWFLQMILMMIVGLLHLGTKSETFNPIWITIVLAIGAISVLLGLFTSLRSIKNTVGRFSPLGAVSLGIPIIALFCSRLLRKFINNNMSEDFNNIFEVVFFEILLCCILFFVGKIHVTIIYLIKKYKIQDREIEHLSTDKSS